MIKKVKGTITGFGKSGLARTVVTDNATGATLYDHINGWKIGDEVELHLVDSMYEYPTLLMYSKNLSR